MTADLKDAAQQAKLRELVQSADIVIEGFRPGVMKQFGLSYADLAPERPDLIHCSITGHGQNGKDAGHDLTYMAQAGLLDAVTDGDGDPPLPPTLVADIGAGALPAALNIVLALQVRQRSGRVVHLDVSVTGKSCGVQSVRPRRTGDGQCSFTAWRPLLHRRDTPICHIPVR